MSIRSIGEKLVYKASGPFVNEASLAAWIDFELNRVKLDTIRSEEDRIGRLISKMDEAELLVLRDKCIFNHNNPMNTGATR